ncbi:MAG TPA: phosphatidate cytidylyltransferase [Bacteroidia bacterium]|nr:phosphatidate cytidylyltransferase [Bacteroidia bacterium]
MDKNLIQRIITGTIFIVVLVSAIWFSVWTMAGLFLLITILGLWEFYGMAEKTGAEPQKIYGLFFGILLILLAFFQKAHAIPVLSLLILPLLFLPFFIELYRKKTNPFANIGWTLLGVFYVALPFVVLLLSFLPEDFLVSHPANYFQSYVIRSDQYDPAPLLTIFVLIWISDTMAYVCGRLFGKHKLWERISPKKTWEGFIGGFIFTIVAGGLIAKYILYKDLNSKPDMLWLPKAVVIKWICVAAVISVTGMLGDLVESLFKRSIDIKDSGTILPGHGGILDRFDALLLAAPFAVFTYYVCDYLSWTAFF